MEKPTTEDVGRALRDGPAAADDDADAVAEADVEFEEVKGRGQESIFERSGWWCYRCRIEC